MYYKDMNDLIQIIKVINDNEVRELYAKWYASWTRFLI